MSESNSPYETRPPSRRRLVLTTGIAVAGALVALVLVILPAEYGIDPTGIGGALGLTAINAPERTLEITDVAGGNERYREVEIPAYGEPVPLPNPGVHQKQAGAPASRTLEITIPAEGQTEIKTVLETGKMIMYTWQTDRGDVYVDFHGHEPAAGDEYWVRYEEQQQGSRGDGSLVAPFAGEHGWFWLNYNEHPVTISLTVWGYYEDLIDYGIF